MSDCTFLSAAVVEMMSDCTFLSAVVVQVMSCCTFLSAAVVQVMSLGDCSLIGFSQFDIQTWHLVHWCRITWDVWQWHIHFEFFENF